MENPNARFYVIMIENLEDGFTVTRYDGPTSHDRCVDIVSMNVDSQLPIPSLFIVDEQEYSRAGLNIFIPYDHDKTMTERDPATIETCPYPF